MFNEQFIRNNVELTDRRVDFQLVSRSPLLSSGQDFWLQSQRSQRYQIFLLVLSL
jgi:hypothetical protein